MKGDLPDKPISPVPTVRGKVILDKAAEADTSMTLSTVVALALTVLLTMGVGVLSTSFSSKRSGPGPA